MHIVLFDRIKTYLHARPYFKKLVGVILVLVGLLALVTPLTPGSWIALIGLELLGVRLLFLDKWAWWRRKE